MRWAIAAAAARLLPAAVNSWLTRKGMRFVIVGCILLVLCGGGLAAAMDAGWLQGSLAITDESGQRIYGERLSVFLTTRAIAVPRCPELEQLEVHRRLDKINQLHLDFYKEFARHRFQPGYLIASAESSDTGNFAFLNVSPGSYYVIVMFPAMIGGYKVAWQEPASVPAGRVVYITLDNRNLAIPADRRDYHR